MTEDLKGELRFYVCNLPSEFDRLHIIPLSDVHLGDPLFSEKHFIRTLEYIDQTPNCYAFLNGDLLNCVIVGKVGNIYGQEIASPQDQRDLMIKYLKPIKHKILAMTTGNHEARIFDVAGMDLSKDIARELNIPYRAEGIGVKIKFGAGNNRMKGKPFVYKGYFTHGYGGARTSSAKAVKGERLSYFLSCDFYSMAHDHLSNGAPVVSLECDHREHYDKETGFTSCAVRSTRAVVVKSAAYLKWGNYGESKGFPPVDLMTPIIKLSGKMHGDFEYGDYPTARALI